MVFGIIMLLQHMYELQVASGIPGIFKPVIDALSIVQPEIILGLLTVARSFIGSPARQRKPW